ncbi:MAG: class I SAM-dependent methyltransferase [Defluviitaleaceae bacterium]|nr:class I SAM-dependent methyltransferase [Defluviitaleaceae bacterium]
MNQSNKHEKYSIQKYNSIARNYDTTPDGRMTADFKAKMLELCKAKDGDFLLDVGCGNGTLIGALKRKANVRAFGIDISPSMIDECKGRYADIDFSVGSGEKLPFDDCSLDVVVTCCVLHHLNEPRNFFREAKRVLKPSGTLIVAEIWLPFGVRHIFDLFSPLYKAGDNKLFSHRRLKGLFAENDFCVTGIYKRGIMQIVKGGVAPFLRLSHDGNVASKP